MGLSLRWTIGEPNPPPLPLSFYPPHLLSRFFWRRCDRRKGWRRTAWRSSVSSRRRRGGRKSGVEGGRGRGGRKKDCCSKTCPGVRKGREAGEGRRGGKEVLTTSPEEGKTGHGKRCLLPFCCLFREKLALFSRLAPFTLLSPSWDSSDIHVAKSQ